MKIVCISDTHGLHRQMPDRPDGDVLVHAGDCLGHGSRAELVEFLEWFSAHPHKHKILVAGNHDWAFWDHPVEAAEICKWHGVRYLEDDEVTIDGVKFYGAPWTPKFFDWAFMLPRLSTELARKWTRIPDDTDVLITHGPPHGIRDEAPMPNPDTLDRHVGCEMLLDRVLQVRPRVHVFGHIHEGYGILEEFHGLQTRTTFVNASICDPGYRPTNQPVVLELGPGGAEVLAPARRTSEARP